MTKKVHIIGSGISSLSSASFLAKAGFDVQIFEKNDSIGGRARQFETQGFVFDVGPSWYWMPDVFEKFYQQFGYTTKDFYELKRLNIQPLLLKENISKLNRYSHSVDEKYFLMIQEWILPQHIKYINPTS